MKFLRHFIHHILKAASNDSKIWAIIYGLQLKKWKLHEFKLSMLSTLKFLETFCEILKSSKRFNFPFFQNF